MRIISGDVGMVLGLDKCAVQVLKGGKMIQREGIESPEGIESAYERG